MRKQWAIPTGVFYLAAVLLAGCIPAQAVYAAASPVSSPTAPPIPTNLPLTPTPSATPLAADSPAPTNTPTPTFTPTFTTTPTTVAPALAASRQPFMYPAAGLAPVNIVLPEPYTVHLSGVSPQLRSIFEHGQQLGNDPRRFSKIGDCLTTSGDFLKPFDAGDYDLGDYAYLNATLTYFRGSFAHDGQGAVDGLSITGLLDPVWANPNQCLPGEDRIACEYRLYRPVVALIFVQPRLTNASTWQTAFSDSLKQSVELSIQSGVIPVLTTQFPWPGREAVVADTNAIIRQAAQTYQVPLWDFHAALVDIPGAYERNWHVSIAPNGSTYFDRPDTFAYGMTIRNLEALQVLDVLRQEVLYQ